MVGRKNTIFHSVSTQASTTRKTIPWSAAPLLLPVVALGLGILLASWLDYGYRRTFVAVSGLLLIPSLVMHLRPRPVAAFAAIASGSLLLSILCFGAWYAGERHPPHAADHFGHQLQEGVMTMGTVRRVRAAGSRTAATVEVDAVINDSVAQSASGLLLTYLEDGDSVGVGKRILLSSLPTKVPPPLNPKVFDYAAYLAGQSIYHRTYTDADEWLILDSPAGLSMHVIGDRSREAWFNSLTPYLSGDNLAVAAALIMGKRDLLGSEVRSAYADTGAIHVLAVSGLHVGILALIVMQLLGWLLPSGSAWFAVRSGVTIGVVWYFALITGLSPSVQRAALMVSVVLLGKSINRRNSIFNLLAISALLMLIVEPKQVFQVGFQLSFAAVTGIALFARGIQRLVHLPGKLHYLWDAISVSTAAQLGTLPFTLYYFGQFPVYFMLSGTLVIVFAYLVLGLGLLHGFLALLGFPGTWLLPTGTLLNWIVEAQNGFIHFCRQLPGATLLLSSFGLISALGLLLLIGTLAYLTYRPSHRARWLAMGTAALLACYWLLSPALLPEPMQFTIYNLPRHTLIDIYDGSSGVVVGDTVPESVRAYQIDPSRKALAVDFSAPISFSQDTSMAGMALAYPLLRLLDRRVLVLDGNEAIIPTEHWPDPDMVLIRNGFRSTSLPLALSELPIVVDGSNAPYLASDWREAYPEAHITAEDGAFQYVME